MPPIARGTRAERRPSAFRALMVSDGNRPCRSTSSAAGPDTSSAMRAIISATSPESETTGTSLMIVVMPPSLVLHLLDTCTYGSDRFEGGLLQHLLRELNVERVLQGQHHVDAGMGSHPRREEIGVLVDRARVHRQSAMLGQDKSNGLVHGSSSLQSGVAWRPLGRLPSPHIPMTTAAASIDSWVRLTDHST